MNDNQISDYITFPRTFENYKWYKPILTIAVSAIAYIIFIVILTAIFIAVFGENSIGTLEQGYEAMNTFDAENIYGFLTLALLIPAIYVGSKIVKDRPFSSYSSSRGGWNWKIYFKTFIVFAVLYFIVNAISILLTGIEHGPNQLTVIAFLTFLIIVPAQCIAEEYLFRGILMQTIGAWTNMPIVALIVQALAFASLHPYNVVGVISTLISGIVFGYIAMKTNGLETGSALHSVNNLFVFYAGLAGITRLQSQVSIFDGVLDILINIAAVVIVLYIGKKYDWFTSHE